MWVMLVPVFSIRKCEAPLTKRSATEAFIDPKPSGDRPVRAAALAARQDNQSAAESMLTDDHQDSDCGADFDDDDPIIPGSERSEGTQGLQDQSGMLLLHDDQPSNNNNTDTAGDRRVAKLKPAARMSELGINVARVGIREVSRSGEVRRLAFEEEEGTDFRLERLPTRRTGKMATKLAKSLELNQKYTKGGGVCRESILCNQDLYILQFKDIGDNFMTKEIVSFR